MTRTHRSLHRIVWPILALLVALGVALALWLRPPPDQAAVQGLLYAAAGAASSTTR
jgi:hypothetical protein